nr:uncharacterized protein LOC111416228 [Onthophagus taurus]
MRKEINMSLNENLDSESKVINNEVEKRQTKWFYDGDDVTDGKIKESRIKSSSFRHMTHISWKDDGSLEISTNDREMAEVFRKIGDNLCLQGDRDVKEVIFDYVVNSMRSEEVDENNLEIDLEKDHELCNKIVGDNTKDEGVYENSIGNEMLDENELERVKIGNIGKPYNFQHVTHCSFDRNSGFNVVTNDRKLSWFYNRKEKKKESKK